MEQDIRFCEVEGSRVAYATLGEGPLLVFGAKWVSHLEEEWDDPRARDFYTGLARSHRVIRYDRLGAGLSARELPRPPSIDLDTRVLRSVIHACGDEPATMFALSCSSVVTASLAARAPKLVRKIASRYTRKVRKVNGYGSRAFLATAFAAIHPPNQTT